MDYEQFVNIIIMSATTATVNIHICITEVKWIFDMQYGDL